MQRPRRLLYNLLIPASLILLLYGISRLVFLTKLPMFTDEAIYIRWSQIGSRDASWRFISLVDGKQPLFTWIMMVVLRVVDDPLFAGRFVSVLAGIGGMIGVWFLGTTLFKSKRIGLLACILYLVCPFTLLYDRLALYDSLAAAISVWNLYIAILLVRSLRLDVALIMGMTLGLGILNKTSGFLSIYMLPLTLLLFDWKKAAVFKRLATWGGLVVIAVVISQAMYSILRLSPLFHTIQMKDSVFVYPFAEWLTHPWRFFAGNMHGLFDWTINYLTWPIYIVMLLSILRIRKWPMEIVLLFSWWILPMSALGLFARILYPRYILSMFLPLLVLAAYSIDWFIARARKPLYIVLFLAVLLAQSLYTDFYIVTDPLHAPIPKSDKGQYIDDWPSGWGVPEVNTYILKQSQQGPVTVYTEGTFGLLPYAMEVYLVDKPNIKIVGIWPLPKEIPPAMFQDARTHPTFFVLKETQVPPAWPLTLIAEYQKGNRSDVKLRFYRVTPK